MLWISFGKGEKTWANIARLVCSFEVEWKTSHHNILVEFLNNWNLDSQHNKIKVLMGEEQRIINKHLLVRVFLIYHIREKDANQVKMINAKITLAKIVNRIINTYNTNEGWVVKKMTLKYDNKIIAILPIIYHKYKVQYFCNKFAMMISKVDHGKYVNWVIIMYYQLVKELIKWGKCQKNMIEGMTKRELKKDVCYFTIVLEVLF